MPELPEVETIRRDLAATVGGARIVAVEATGARTIRRYDGPSALVSALTGAGIADVRRHGKYLLVDLEGREESLIVHLRMSGQLLLTAGAAAGDRPKHTHVVVHLDDGRELRFVDPRTFGEVFVARPSDALAHIGPDALVDVQSPKDLGAVTAGRRRKLKDLLMDQRAIAGIGNIYSDEILWTARLRFDRVSNTLTQPELRRLFRAVHEVLLEAIAHRGSSLADEQYRDLFGAVGRYAARHRVFAREGQPCPRCRRPIVRIRYGGRSHFFCGRCQP